MILSKSLFVYTYHSKTVFINTSNKSPPHFIENVSFVDTEIDEFRLDRFDHRVRSADETENRFRPTKRVDRILQNLFVDSVLSARRRHEIRRLEIRIRNFVEFVFEDQLVRSLGGEQQPDGVAGRQTLSL